LFTVQTHIRLLIVLLFAVRAHARAVSAVEKCSEVCRSLHSVCVTQTFELTVSVLWEPAQMALIKMWVRPVWTNYATKLSRTKVLLWIKHVSETVFMNLSKSLGSKAFVQTASTLWEIEQVALIKMLLRQVWIN